VVEATGIDGPTKTINSGSQLTIHLTDTAHYGIALLRATGLKPHLDQLSSLAHKKRMALGEDGLRRGKDHRRKTEEKTYGALGLPLIEIELREGQGEIALALAGKVPSLVTDKDVRGIFHAHTDMSDGGDTLEIMAEATRARGYQYFGVADHSKSAHYAGGLSIEEIEQQHAEIDRLNKRYGQTFRILKGIES
jgi:DNA polymerase (family 10)